jgi:DNA-binding transcriptional ArsR family regulator
VTSSQQIEPTPEARIPLTPGGAVFTALSHPVALAVMENLERREARHAGATAVGGGIGGVTGEPEWVDLLDLQTDPALAFHEKSVRASVGALRRLGLLDDRRSEQRGRLEVRLSAEGRTIMKMARECVREAHGLDDYHHDERRVAVARALGDPVFLQVVLRLAESGDQGLEMADIARIVQPDVVVPTTAWEQGLFFDKLQLWDRIGRVLREAGLGEAVRDGRRHVRYRLHPSIAEALLRAAQQWVGTPLRWPPRRTSLARDCDCWQPNCSFAAGGIGEPVS